MLQPFRVLTKAVRHLVEIVRELFDLIAGRNVQPVIEFAPPDQRRPSL